MAFAQSLSLPAYINLHQHSHTLSDEASYDSLPFKTFPLTLKHNTVRCEIQNMGKAPVKKINTENSY